MALLRLQQITKAYRHAQRYIEILSVLIRHGFDDLIENLPLDKYLPAKLLAELPGKGPVNEGDDEKKQSDSKIEKQESGEATPRHVRLRMALEELGATFVKAGQMLSTRPDFVPSEFLDELKKLQDDVKPVSIEEITEIVETELGGAITEKFLRFESEPLAAASIGQVHKATLPNGTNVVVKVRRPGLVEQVQVDLEILQNIAGLMEEYSPEIAEHRPLKLVNQFVRLMEKEVDFTNEAGRLRRFQEIFDDNEAVCFPSIYESHSTEAVLCMEQVEGIKASDTEALETAGHDLKQLAATGADVMMEQIFTYGFFHADPHPGNLFVRDDGRICFIDFGLTARLSQQTRENLADILYAVEKRDAPAVTNALIRMTDYEEMPDRAMLEGEVAEFIDRHAARKLEDFSLMLFFRELSQLTNYHKLYLPPAIFLLVKSLGSLEELTRRLDPEIDLLGRVKPYIQRVWWGRMNPQQLQYQIPVMIAELLRGLPSVSEDAKHLLQQASHGKATLNLKLSEHEKLGLGFEKTGNRLAYAVVVAALLVGSSLLVHAGQPPMIAGMSVLGTLGFLLATIMSVHLLFSIAKKGLR
jgi:ubiquinone biosynthesis protein